MDFHYLIGYFLAVLVGITLGLIGSGGSILSVPILVYILHVEPVLATAYSLFIVGSTALVGGIQKAKEKLVDYKKAVLFGIPTVVTVFITRIFFLPSLPKIIYITSDVFFPKAVLIMIVFAVVMLFASISMIKKSPKASTITQDKVNYPLLILKGFVIGFVAGFVGAGGGFLIVPVLLFFAKTPMKMAIGTSLFIIASQSLIGFIGDLQMEHFIDWKLLFIFTSLSILGFFVGNAIAKKVDGEKLKTSFGYFVLFMGIFIMVKELFLS